MMEGDAIVMTIGSKYKVRSLDTREKALESVGIFKGYVAVGADDGLCLELTEEHGEMAGKTRVLMTHMITSIDVLESAEEDKKKELESTSVYFG